MRISYPKTDHLLCSSMRQASFKCETPRLELKSLRSFLAIKRCQRTKSKNVIKQSWSSIYKLAQTCATSGKAVNSVDSFTHKGLGGKEHLPPCRFPTIGIVWKVLSTLTQLPPQTSSPWWCRLPLLQCGIYGLPQSDEWSAIWRVWPRAIMLGLI